MFGLVLLVAACAPPAGSALDGRTFLSTGVTVDGEPFDLVEDTRIQLTFGPDGQIGASAGCNSIGGTYRIDGTALVFEGGGMTEMGCDPERHAQDDWLSELLGSRPAITLAGNDLTVPAGTPVVKLVEREVALPDLGLIGPLWTVDSIITGDAVASIGGATATLRFNADGIVDIASGCNTGWGTYDVDGDTIAFSDIVTTDMACAGPADALERAVLGVLGAGTLSATIDAERLTLTDGTDGLSLIGS